MIVGRRFEDQRLALGDEGYERCAFVRCRLVFDGRPVHLVDNTFEACSWLFEGAAGVTIDFVGGLCRDDPGVRAGLARVLGLDDAGAAAPRAHGPAAPRPMRGPSPRPTRRPC